MRAQLCLLTDRWTTLFRNCFSHRYFKPLQAVCTAATRRWSRASRLSHPAVWGRFQRALRWERRCQAQAGKMGKQSPITGCFALQGHPPNAPPQQLRRTTLHAPLQGESKPCLNTRSSQLKRPPGSRGLPDPSGPASNYTPPEQRFCIGPRGTEILCLFGGLAPFRVSATAEGPSFYRRYLPPLCRLHDTSGEPGRHSKESPCLCRGIDYVRACCWRLSRG